MKTQKQIIVKVTQEDITKGVKGNVNSCAIARAVKRAVGKGLTVSVGDGVDVSSKDGEHYAFADLSKKAQRFIQRFDEGEKVKPFNLRVNVPVKPAKPVLKQITVCVTKDDIQNGVANDAEACPVGRALSRHNFSSVEVGAVEGEVSFYDQNRDEAVERRLPPKAAKFIAAFDAGKKVKPFKFHINVRK